MTPRSRATLKKYFGPGARPSTDQFGDLIDSALIMDDEGFSKTVEDGLKIVTLGAANALVSFERPVSERPEWSIGFLDGKSDQLGLKRGPLKSSSLPMVAFEAGLATAATNGANGAKPASAALLRLNAQVGIGLGADPPRSALDVKGVVRADGRLGREVQVPADGKYHPITDELGGCVAFEVMAGVGSPGQKRFALMHALAMNTFNPSPWDNIFFLKKRIRCRHAYYGRWSDQLQLRWAPSTDTDDPNKKYGDGARYVLQIRSRTDYADPDARVPKPQITAFVTKLWFDAHMVPPPPPDPTATGNGSSG